MRIIFLTVLSLLISDLTQAQVQKRFDLFYIAGNNNFAKTSDQEVNNNYDKSLTANLSIPIVLKDSSVWFTSLDFQNYNVNTEFSATSPRENLDLHGFILRTGYIHRFNAKKSLQTLFVPRYMSDYNTSFSNSLQFGGMVMYENKKSKDLTWRAGLLYNQEFFGTYLVPLFYLDWKVSNKIKVKGILPIYGKVYIQPSDNFSAGFHFVGLTTTYRVTDRSLDDYYVDRRTIDVSLFSNVKIWKDVFLETRFGYSLVRDYGLYAEGDKMTLGLPLLDLGDDRVRLNKEGKSSPFIHFKLIYSLPID